MNKFRSSACALVLCLFGGVASAGGYFAYTYDYLDGNGNVVGTAQVNCDGSVVTTGQVTGTAIMTGRDVCTGADVSSDIDPEVPHGPI